MHRTYTSAFLVGCFGLTLGACGGAPARPVPASATSAADALPWEAALTAGARFELVRDAEFDEGGEPAEPLVVTVESVDVADGARVYHLDGGSTVTQIVVRGAQVLLNEAAPADMVEPYTDHFMPDVTCYAEDFSNPDGCDDVCEAELCLGPSGIIRISGLYAPNYLPYLAR